MKHDPLAEERLLDLVVDPESCTAEERAALAADSASSARAEELRHFLATCRSALGEDEALAAADEVGRRRIVDGVLTRTTREDLSWRGDLGVVMRFVRRRLADSMGLRVVAASLLVHLIAGPAVLAYFAFFAEQPFIIKFEMPEEPYPEDPVEPLHELLPGPVSVFPGDAPEPPEAHGEPESPPPTPPEDDPDQAGPDPPTSSGGG